MGRFFGHEQKPKPFKRPIGKVYRTLPGSRCFKIGVWYSGWTELQFGINAGLDGPNVEIFLPFGLCFKAGWFGAAFSVITIKDEDILRSFHDDTLDQIRRDMDSSPRTLNGGTRGAGETGPL